MTPSPPSPSPSRRRTSRTSTAAIDQTRWPDAETVDDWTQGAPLAKVRALVDHWRHLYDWRRCEAMLNDWGQYKTAIDGLDIHFLHVRSKHENALPLIITHGWPGSVIEFMKIIGPLTDPTPRGGKAEDAFPVVAPSLPGHGFSDKATSPPGSSLRCPPTKSATASPRCAERDTQTPRWKP